MHARREWACRFRRLVAQRERAGRPGTAVGRGATRTGIVQALQCPVVTVQDLRGGGEWPGAGGDRCEPRGQEEFRELSRRWRNPLPRSSLGSPRIKTEIVRSQNGEKEWGDGDE